ncbi:hypothetical protein D3C86_2036840 [compost metagenome]
MLEHLHTVHSRQAEVEDRQVELFIEQGVQGTGAIGQPVDGVTLLAQAAAHACAQGVVVFDEEKSHGRP